MPESYQAMSIVLPPGFDVATGAPAARVEVPAATPSLRSRAIHGSVWTIAGHGLSQVLRLGGNLIMTRLLFPEAFGLMALVQIFTQAVQMFSDIGLRGSIVHNRRGDDREFLNTAWTLQVIRGLLLWGCLCLMAWPAAWFYEAPGLTKLIPVVGLAALINGFESTAKHSLIRRIAPAKLVVMDLSIQLMAMGVMVAFAWVRPSVWALVVGGLFGAVARTLWSHFLIADYSNRFAFDRDAARSLFRFGRWILISTALTFILSQADRVVLGKMLTTAELGVYAVAFFLSQAVLQAVRQVSTNILIPVSAQLAKRGTPELRHQTARFRATLLMATVPPMCLLVVWGQQIIDLLYDDRYGGAGWMLQTLAVRSIGLIITIPASAVLLAVGDSFRQMLLQVSRSVLFVVALVVGGLLGDVRGLLLGMAVAAVLEYPILVVLIRRYGVWLPKLDITVFGLSTVSIAIGLCLS